MLSLEVYCEQPRHISRRKTLSCKESNIDMRRAEYKRQILISQLITLRYIYVYALFVFLNTTR